MKCGVKPFTLRKICAFPPIVICHVHSQRREGHYSKGVDEDYLRRSVRISAKVPRIKCQS